MSKTSLEKGPPQPFPTQGKQPPGDVEEITQQPRQDEVGEARELQRTVGFGLSRSERKLGGKKTTVDVEC